jgi:hypothetical protein
MASPLQQSTSPPGGGAAPGELRFPRLGFGCWQLGSKGADDYWGLEFTDAMADDLVQL